MDSQIVELAGRHFLTGELLRSNIEVALPIRDRGIDLIAYIDIDSRVRTFISCPIQLKAASKRSFSINKKYEKVRNLLIAYVWNLSTLNETCIYALTYKEAYSIADKLGYTQSPSWQRGSYSNNHPGKELLENIEKYRMTPERWWHKLTK
jgi:hypothetical protein